MIKGDFDRAAADYSEAVRLDPKYAGGYVSRADLYLAKGEFDRAIADYSEAIRLSPKYSYAYRNRGVANLYAGAPAKALADVNQASEIDPKSGYHALWLDIVGQRNNLPSRLAASITTIDMTTWPAPVLRMLLGQLTPAAVLAAADGADESDKQSRRCDANFYAGIVGLRQQAKDEAARLFQLAMDNCLRTYVEWSAANAELKALGKSP